MGHIKTFENFDDLMFTGSYWKKLTDFRDRIEKELPIINLDSTIKDAGTGGMLRTMRYKDITDWHVPGNQSETLTALANKISYMITKGRGNDVPVLLDRIVNKGTKKLTQPRMPVLKGTTSRIPGEFLGHGHFRWNFQGYTLNDREMYRLREFFGI